ncbi:hypothetical protein [Nonomuraea sp. NPDC005650]|uniref:hypothetical protein n=1 Tax=Nonomuraea sp. NPDC005650 TaxID=3157045 RepID=UPI0033B70211
MAIGIDGNSPAVVSAGNTTTVTTASFTRPVAGSLLVAMVMCTSDSAPAVSGGSLTWTLQKQQVNSGTYAQIWTAPVTGSGAMTVTLTVTGSLQGLAMKVDGVTGAHASSPIGNSGGGTSTTNAITPTGYTSSADNSRGFAAFFEENGLGNPTSSDTGFAWTASFGLGDYSGIAVRKAANTPTSGTAVTFNADAAGAGAAAWTWAALEIKPASTDAPITTDTVAVVTAVPTPTTTVSASPVPATVAAVAGMPSPAVSSGSNVHLATVAAAANVPAPSVTTENTEIVEPDTIAATTTMPAPAVATSTNAALATIAAVVQMYAPTIQSDAHVTLTPVAVLADVPAPAVTVPVLPGDAITRPGQIEWNGFLLGALTPYSWQGLEGWVDSAPFVSGNVDRPDSSGSYPGQPYLAERVINWATLLKMPRDMVGQIVHDLVMATGPAQDENEGWLVIWDFDDIQPWLVRAHLSDRKPGPIDRNARLGLMRGGLQWTASDPRRFNPVRSSLTIVKDVETAILNAGNDATPGELRFPGPCTAPQVENLTTDTVLAFNTVIGSGQTLVIDVKEGRAYIGDVDHLNDIVDGSTSIQDCVFAPGANTLLFTCGSGGTAGMETFWRDAVS